VEALGTHWEALGTVPGVCDRGRFSRVAKLGADKQTKCHPEAAIQQRKLPIKYNDVFAVVLAKDLVSCTHGKELNNAKQK
jgi:hypothetical protein